MGIASLPVTVVLELWVVKTEDVIVIKFRSVFGGAAVAIALIDIDGLVDSLHVFIAIVLPSKRLLDANVVLAAMAALYRTPIKLRPDMDCPLMPL